jgi:hypothetical protein
MAEKTSIKELGLCEVPDWNNLRVQSALARLLDHTYPAFIMRSSTQSGSIETGLRIHDAHTLNVAYALGRLSPSIPNELVPLRSAQPSTAQKKAVLVSDATTLERAGPDLATTMPEVHTTLAGGGDIYIAHIGSSATHAQRAARLPIDNDNHPSRMLSFHNQVDPEVINPLMFVGRVTFGDSVVTAGSFGKYAVWQRFDSDPDLGERVYSLDRIVPVDSERLGFDL